MKEFDFEAAKQGAAVCTRSGLPVRIICFDANNYMFRIVAMVRNIATGMETPQSYREDGGWLPANTECDQDLMMRDDDYQARLARGRYSLGNEADRPTVKESLIVGLSRREEFAKAAMQGLCANIGASQGAGFIGAWSVSIADATIAELDKPSEK